MGGVFGQRRNATPSSTATAKKSCENERKTKDVAHVSRGEDDRCSHSRGTMSGKSQNNREFQVDVTKKKGLPYFVGSEICEA